MSQTRTTEHKEGKATVRAVYYTSKTLADGSHPFMLCITKNRARKYLSTGLSLLPKYWNESKTGYRQAIRKSYPDIEREALINALADWEKKYDTAAGAIASNDEQHTVADVAQKAIEGRKATRRVQVLAYVDELIATMTASRQLGNARVYRDMRRQLAKFILDEYGTADVPFDRVTVAFCTEWENTLRASGNEGNTLSQRFRTLRAVLNKAIANGVAKPENYPFARNVAERHKFNVGKFDLSTTKRALTRADVRKLEALQPTIERLRLAKNVFLFSFYVGGVNFIDLSSLRWQNLSHDADGHPRVNYVRRKTGGKFSIRLLAPAAAIVEYYRPTTQTGPDGYIFPIINGQRHQTPTQISNRLHKLLRQVNGDLKELAAAAGISTDITTYTARHSFATSLKHLGVATGVISESMGHKSEGVTAVYLDSFASDVLDSAFENLL
jgi:integrase